MAKSVKSYIDGKPTGAYCAVGACVAPAQAAAMVVCNLYGIAAYPYVPLCAEHFRAIVSGDYPDPPSPPDKIEEKEGDKNG